MNEVLDVPETPVTTPAGGAASLIRSRRTIHDFREEPAPAHLVRKGLDLARWAPNHHLTEPWRFYLLGPETAAAIARLNAEIVTAKSGPEAGAAKLDRWSRIPGWIVVTCANTDDPLRAREDYAACCCAIHNFSLFRPRWAPTPRVAARSTTSRSSCGARASGSSGRPER